MDTSAEKSRRILVSSRLPESSTCFQLTTGIPSARSASNSPTFFILNFSLALCFNNLFLSWHLPQLVFQVGHPLFAQPNNHNCSWIKVLHLIPTSQSSDLILDFTFSWLCKSKMVQFISGNPPSSELQYKSPHSASAELQYWNPHSAFHFSWATVLKFTFRFCWATVPVKHW